MKIGDFFIEKKSSLRLVTQIMKTGVVPATHMKNAMSESSSFCLSTGESVTSRSLQFTGWPAQPT